MFILMHFIVMNSLESSLSTYSGKSQDHTCPFTIINVEQILGSFQKCARIFAQKQRRDTGTQFTVQSEISATERA